MGISELVGNLKKSKSILAPLIIVLIILRMSVLTLMLEASTSLIIKHIITTLGWLGVAYFMFNCSLDFRRNRYEKERIKHMKQVAFWATLACLARLASTVVYQWPIISDNYLNMAHVFVELVTWVLLAIFFGCYWLLRARQDKEMSESHDRD